MLCLASNLNSDINHKYMINDILLLNILRLLLKRIKHFPVLTPLKILIVNEQKYDFKMHTFGNLE